MSINYNEIIENDFELPLYKKKHDEVLEYLKTFSFTDFFTIVNNVGGSERRMMRLIDQMVENGELIVKNNCFDIPNNYNKYKDIDFNYIEREIKTIIDHFQLYYLIKDRLLIRLLLIELNTCLVVMIYMVKRLPF